MTTIPLSRSECLLPTAPYDQISSISFSPDSTLLFIASWDCTLSIYKVEPQFDPKRGQIAPQIQFASCLSTPSPITTVLSLSPTLSIIGLVSGQICVIDTRVITQPKITFFYVTEAPIICAKFNSHHDIVVILDLSGSIFMFHRLQLSSTTAQLPLYIYDVPFLMKKISSNGLSQNIRIPKNENFEQNQNKNQILDQNYEHYDPKILSYLNPLSSPTTPMNSSDDVVTPNDISPKYPIAMDTYDDFIIIALHHSIEIYQIHSTIRPSLNPTTSLNPTPNNQPNNVNKGDIGTHFSQTSILTSTHNLSGSALQQALRSISLSISKSCAYYAPITAQLTSISIIPSTLEIINHGDEKTDQNNAKTDAPHLTTHTTPQITKRIGFVIGSLEGRAAVDYITVSPLSADEQAIFAKEDEKKRFAFKCHRNIKNGGNLPSENIIYSINDISCHPTVQSFATCGGDGLISIWSEKLKKKLCSFGSKSLPIERVLFSPDGKLIVWAESIIYGAMGNADIRPTGGDVNQGAVMEFGFGNSRAYSGILPTVLETINGADIDSKLFEFADELVDFWKLNGKIGKNGENNCQKEEMIMIFFQELIKKDQKESLFSFLQQKGFTIDQINHWLDSRAVSNVLCDDNFRKNNDKNITSLKDKKNIDQNEIKKNKFRIFARIVNDQMIQSQSKR